MAERLNRRDLLKSLGAAAVALPGCAGAMRQRADAPLAEQAAPDDGGNLPKPLPRQAAWQDYELGLVYHFDLDVYMPGGHHHERSRREQLDMNLYNPAKLDTDQWLSAATAMGARYAVLTATHHTGFLQWQSDAYDYGLKQCRWGGGKADLVKDFIESCRKVGVAPGIYLGIRFNAHWQVYGYKMNGGKGGDEAKRKQYMRVCEKMVEELCTRYGPLCEMWFDGGVISPEQGGPDLVPIAGKHQPNMVFYHSPDRAEHRWAGSETGTAAYPCWATMPSVGSQIRGHGRDPKHRKILMHGDPDGAVWCPAMADAPIREHDWLWVPNHENRVQPLDRLLGMYEKSVGRNANLILGAVPDSDGLIPEPDFKRYAEFGKAIRRRFGKPLARTEGTGLTVELRLPRPARVDCVCVMEDITRGERVREYVVEGLTAGSTWQALGSGTSVGHKRIQRFGPVEVAAVRFRATRAAATPRIRQLAAYLVG